VAATSQQSPDETRRIATVPNLLTVLRVILVIPFASLAARGEDGAALAVFFVAGLTDALDGHLARRLGQRSMLGRLADPLADKLLTSVAFAVLAFFRTGLPAIPAWLAITVIARDVLILAGAGLVYAKARSSAFAPTVFGKLNTLLEIAVVIGFLAGSGVAGFRPLLEVFYYLLLLSILVSGGYYVRQGVGMLRSPVR
jgi:cardiolipin synthase (CMP-forming)